MNIRLMKKRFYFKCEIEFEYLNIFFKFGLDFNI